MEMNDSLRDFKVYLHEKNQFWPSPDLNAIGQSKVVSLRKVTEAELKFSIIKMKMIPDPSVCEDDPKYSFTGCVQDWVKSKTGCGPDWQDLTCTNLTLYKDVLLQLQQETSERMIQKTGCKPKCISTTYVIDDLTTTNVFWNTNWVSSLYLNLRDTAVKTYTQKIEFGHAELIADFGSYLGLFLGWSTLSLTMSIPDFFKSLFARFDKPVQDENHK